MKQVRLAPRSMTATSPLQSALRTLPTPAHRHHRACFERLAPTFLCPSDTKRDGRSTAPHSPGTSSPAFIVSQSSSSMRRARLTQRARLPKLVRTIDLGGPAMLHVPAVVGPGVSRWCQRSACTAAGHDGARDPFGRVCCPPGASTKAILCSAGRYGRPQSGRSVRGSLSCPNAEGLMGRAAGRGRAGGGLGCVALRGCGVPDAAEASDQVNLRYSARI